RSGVAKTTIYRRYANTDDLLRHLSVAVGEPLDFSGFDTTFDGLRGVLKCIVDCFDEELGLKAIGVVLSS
ncbi:TetR family transcriptional regulator, partial [Bifidobacterium animalis subsp. lactis]